MSTPDSQPGPVRTARTSTAWLGVAIALAVVVGTILLAPRERAPTIAWSAVVAAASGFAASAIGVYGGVLVPGLLLAGVDARFAAAASLFLQVLVIPLGVGEHRRLGNVRRHVVVPLVLGGAFGAFAGPFAASALPETTIARVVAGTIVLVGLVVLAAARFGTPQRVATTDVPRARIGGVGLVSGFASGVSGTGWGPIGVKLLILLGVEPRHAIGSSLVGRVFMAISAVIGYVASSAVRREVELDPWLLPPLLVGSIATLVLGARFVSRLDRDRAVILVALLSIALALPTLVRGG